MNFKGIACLCVTAVSLLFSIVYLLAEDESRIGQEVSIELHLRDGEEFEVSIDSLLEFGEKLLAAVWTVQEGGGRPLTKGTGAPLSDPSDPLIFPRNFNRVSAPDANSCAGCHNQPFGVTGGGGDIVANVFVLGQRFDFATFDSLGDPLTTKSTIDEEGKAVTLQNIGNSRATLGMFGSGFIEMLARQITSDLQEIRDSIGPGQTRALTSKGIFFGILRRNTDASWDISGVEGLSPLSLKTSGPDNPPSLVIRPFHQAGAVVSLREFTNNAFNHHHGIQSTERFGIDTDPDGDGFTNEMTRADVTAASLFQATMPVPGRVIPNEREIERAIRKGEKLFERVGCSSCHISSLPLDNEGWIFSEPNPFNPPGNLQVGEAPPLEVDLTDPQLPGPRLQVAPDGVVYVPAFTDFKIHDICADENDPNIEPLDQSRAGSPEFFGRNRRFITRKLWGIANEPPFFHHGQFTTMREAILAHRGEADDVTALFERLTTYNQNAIIEFLKSLQILPPGSTHLIVDENGDPKEWRVVN